MTNRISKIFFTLLTCSIILTLVSCKNDLRYTDENDETIIPPTVEQEQQSKKATIRVKITDKQTINRTIVPEDPDISELHNFILTGKINGNEKSLGNWNNSNSLQNTALSIEIGNWDFTLSAQKGDSTYKANLTKKIQAGENTLQFILSRIDNGTGKGSLDFVLDFSATENTSEITFATAAIQNIDGSSTIFTEQQLEPQNSKIIYSLQNIPVGTYRIILTLYSEQNKNSVLTKYTELVTIASDLCSRQTRIIDSFKNIYHITYHLNDDDIFSATFEDYVQETFTRNSETFELPIPERKNCTFGGWYTDSNFTNKITEINTSTCQDINLYAKWYSVALKEIQSSNQRIILYDSKENMKQIVFDNDIHEYYVEYFGDILPLKIIPLCNDVNINIQSDTQNINDSSIHDMEITITAMNDKLSNKYILHTVKLFNYTDACTAIENRTDDLYIIISGYLSTYELDRSHYHYYNDTKLSKALNSGNTNVYLDLSRALGLSSLPEAAFYNCCSLTEIIIPSVSSIDFEAFRGCSNLTDITIPDSVTRISDSVFSGCSNLTDITIPNSVTRISNSVFYGCSNLTEIAIPDSVTSIGYGAFSGCSSLTEIAIPDSVTSIDEHAFSGCSSLTEIAIPDSVSSIDEYAFSGCSSLTDITIPDSVTSIGSYAFKNCSSLTNITIPDSVTSIGYGAFGGCSSLTEIAIPDSVTSIGSYAFLECSSLTNITIPDSVTRIFDSVFSGCSNLTDITIPNSVTSIGQLAFKNCSSLTNIKIPDSVTSISNDTFDGCTNLTQLTIPYTLHSCINKVLITEITNITSINDKDFLNYSRLNKVTISDCVTNIGEYAFEYCSNLTDITIPDSVTSIGEFAFYGCSSLTDITIPDSVTAIDKCAFGACSSLTNITIPDSVTSIGQSAFSGCSSLTNIIIPDSVTSISDGAFSGCSSLTNITIPDSVTSIGQSAFYNCSSLTNITIPDSVTSIDEFAFSGCSSLTDVTIPDSVTTIDKCAFQNCSGLTSITIPDSVTTIGEYAFEYCSSLTNITIPGNVTSIGKYAFLGCKQTMKIIYSNTMSKFYTVIKRPLNSQNKHTVICTDGTITL